MDIDATPALPAGATTSGLGGHLLTPGLLCQAGLPFATVAQVRLARLIGRLADRNPSARIIRTTWRCAVPSPAATQQARDALNCDQAHRSGALPSGDNEPCRLLCRTPTAAHIMRHARHLYLC
jgi:hypothetical protein